jgi:hypothetical protein
VNDEEDPNAVLVGVGLPHITLLPLKCVCPLHVCIFSVEPTKSRTELEQNIILCPSRFILAGRYKKPRLPIYKTLKGKKKVKKVKKKLTVRELYGLTAEKM